MSESDHEKKLIEEMALELFLAEYQFITGRRIESYVPSERPDFLCVDSVGEKFGIELVRVMLDPESVSYLRILKNEEFADPFDTYIRVQEAIARKDYLRRTAGWSLPDNTVLILQLIDAPIESVAKFFGSEILEAGEASGFSEIWLVDYTVEEAYSTVQLYGIIPKCFSGLHDRALGSSKPYG